MEIHISKREENNSRRVRILIDGDSRVEQSHRERVDINTIMSQCSRGGLFPQRSDVPTYGDFRGAEDFHTALIRIDSARDDFGRLPSDIRSRFDNDPGKLLDFLGNADNLGEARELGLIPKADTKVSPGQIVDPAASGDVQSARGDVDAKSGS